MGHVKILKASAGSGKTYRLAYEYIKGIVQNPLLYRATLAVTFTNKATEQMKRRIVDSLHALAEAPETAPPEGDNITYLNDLMRETGLSRSRIVRNAAEARTLILHDYSRFAVSTIDKFFQRVARAFFRELGLELDYTVEIDRDWVLTAAVDRLLERTASDATLRGAVDRLLDERSLDGKGWDIRPDMIRIGEELFKESYVPNQQSAEQVWNTYCEIAHELNLRFGQVKERAKQALEIITRAGLDPTDFKQGKNSFAVYLSRLAESDEPLPYNSYFARSTESVGEWCNKTSPLKERIQGLERELMPCLEAIREGVDALWMDYTSRDLVREKLGRSLLLSALGEEVRAVAAEQTRVMIHETAALIHRLVTGNDAPFIYEKVGNAYARYMIDEFQDTSENQWQNFVPLLDNALAENDGEPVMLIGDVKQSIYRWRGGNWRILGSEAEAHFAEALADTAPMDTNWRSERHIIDFNNRLMRGVVERDADDLTAFLEAAPPALRSWADILRESYRGFEQKVAPAKMKQEPKGYVEVVPAYREQTAAILVERVRDMLTRGYTLRDIAVLVRSNGEARTAADTLLEAGYPIVSQEALLLSGSPVVEFVMAVYTLADAPEDTIARAQYNTFRGLPYGTPLADDERDFIAGLLCLSLVESFEAILEHYKLGERSEAVSYLQALYQAVLSYSKQPVSDIPLLLEWWADKGRKKTVYLPSEQDAITIMTIHKAKGLEFPCVMIPYCSWDLLPQTNRGGTTLWVEAADETAGRFAELGTVPVSYKKAMAQSHFAADYYRESVYAHVDNLNLLYVALTRAEQELYVMYEPVGKNGHLVSTLIDAVVPTLEEVQEHPYTLPDGSEAACYVYGTKHTAASKSDVSETKVNQQVMTHFSSRNATQRLRVHWASDRYFGEDRAAVSPRRYGVLMHRLFELLESPEALDSAIERMQVSGELTSADEAAMLRERAAAALSNPEVARWFSPEWKVIHSERDIITEGGHLRRPDRVMTDGNHRAVVVDYKFGAFRRAGYQTQVQEYMNLLRSMGYTEVEGYLWFVELGEVEQVG